MENKYKYLPDEMKNLKRFIGFRIEILNGKTTKIPFSLINNRSTGWNDKEKWLSFNEIKSKNENLGFVLDNDYIFCVDLDYSIKYGKLTDMAKNIIDDFKGTYIEISQTGQGLHIFGKGNIPSNMIKPSEGLEIYKENRYIALTGNVGDGRYFPISNKLVDKQSEINSLYKKWTQERVSIKKQIEKYKDLEIHKDYSFYDLSASEIIEVMKRTNTKAKALLSGISITGDHSRDDFIFLSLARNYTNGNPHLMKELFLLSPLSRLGSNEKRKDDRKYIDYLKKTIESTLKFSSFIPFDWSKHLEFKKRSKPYERF